MSVNENRFIFKSKKGTEFRADRSDFENGVTVIVPWHVPEEALLTDTSEMIGYHLATILPNLNEFKGYDCIEYAIVRETQD